MMMNQTPRTASHVPVARTGPGPGPTPAPPAGPIRRCDLCRRPASRLYYATATGELLCRACDDDRKAAPLRLETKG